MLTLITIVTNTLMTTKMPSEMDVAPKALSGLSTVGTNNSDPTIWRVTTDIIRNFICNSHLPQHNIDQGSIQNIQKNYFTWSGLLWETMARRETFLWVSLSW